MGLPIAKLVLATNENDVLDEFFKTGEYRVRSANETYETSSPSMDISKASNFERFIFDLTGRDAERVAQHFSRDLTKHGGFSITEEEKKRLTSQYGFVSGSSTHQNRLQTIARVYEQYGYLLDPHTADGVKVALEQMDAETPMVVMETALPCKFAKTIEEALNVTPPLPEEMVGLMQLPHRVEVLPVDVEAVKRQIVEQGLYSASPK